MDDVTELWDDSTDVANYSNADFEGRRATVSIWDKGGFYRDVLAHVGTAFDCSPHLALDVCIRLYLAHISETHDGAIHDAFEQTRLIPPRGWLDAHVGELSSVNVPVEDCGDRDVDPQYNPATSETVAQMVTYACNSLDVATGPSQFAMQAVTYVVGGYSDDGPMLHNRR